MVLQASQTADLPLTRRPGSERARPVVADDEIRLLGIRASTVLAVFMATLMIPASLRIGPLKLTLYTALLIVLIIPLLRAFLRDKTNRFVALDWFMIANVLWMGIAILHNHGLDRAVFVVNTTITNLGGYMMGRVLIRRTTDYERLFRYFFYGLMIWMPFALLELLTKQTPIRDYLGIFMEVDPRPNNTRMGLNRVQAFTDHPITFGLFCSMGLANIYYIYSTQWFKRIVRTGLVFFVTLLSLSSAPSLASFLQFGLIGWNSLLGRLRYKWVMLVILGGGPLLVLQMAAPNGIAGLIIDNLSYDPVTGWTRAMILDYGLRNAIVHPVFGLGLNDWFRPWWLGPSVDNFWLVLAMRYGFPALIFLWIGLFIHAWRIMSQKGLSEELAGYRAGHLFAWVGMIFVLGTVHIWGSTAVFIMTYIGAGAWLYTGPETREPPRPLRTRDVGRAGALARSTEGPGGIPRDVARPSATPRPARPTRSARRA